MNRRPPAYALRLVVGVLCVVVTAVPHRGAAQEDDVAVGMITPDIFTEQIAVEVIEVEVRVTDKKGRPIPGLARDDFGLSVDGQPVEIEYFEAVGFEEPGRVAPDRKGVPGAEEDRPPERSLVIFLDQAHLSTTGRRQLVRGMDRFLHEELDPRVPVMVASGAEGLQVIQELTLDRQEVLDALASEERAVPGGIYERTARASAVREVQQILESNGDCPLGHPCDCALSQMVATVRTHAAEISGRVEDTLSALDTLVAALRGLPGNKAVLVASDGLAFRPGLGLFRHLMDLCPLHEMEISREAQAETDLLPVYRAVTSHAAANRVTFYSLETAGLQAHSEVSGFEGSRMSQRAHTANLQHALFLLADETGGEAVLNANRFDQELEEIALDLDAYYSLGSTPDHPGSDEVHQIHVQVGERHHDVRYRRKVRHTSLDGRIAERMLGALLFGVEQNPLGVQAAVEVVPDDGEGTPAGGSLPARVVVRVPLSDLVLNPGADDAVGLVRLVLSVQPKGGEWSPMRQKRIPVRVPPTEDPTLGVREMNVELELAPGDYYLALGVRDEMGGETSYLREEVRVGG